MAKAREIRSPQGLAAEIVSIAGPQVELHLQADLLTLREIVDGLDRLEDRLNRSEIPAAVSQRGYFTPDEDDRVRQGLLAYRNYRLAAYEIILRYRDYAAVADKHCRFRGFLLAFGAALVLYAKSLKIISFAEHVPLLRAKINEPDMKFELEAGFFDDVLAGYSSLANYRSLSRAAAFWWTHRRAILSCGRQAGLDWVWLTDLVRHHRHVVRKRLLHVLLQRFRHDWRSFGQSLLSPLRAARHGLERLLGERLADARLSAQPAYTISLQTLESLRPLLRAGDVLLMRADSRLTAALLPGFWTHAAVFLGTAAELEALGVRASTHAARHWNKIVEHAGAFGQVIEALFPCVRLNPLEKCLEADHVVALRPRLALPELAAAMGEVLGHLGKPYDFEFDFSTTSRMVCTELVYRSFHHRGPISFSLTKRLGRFTLSGDDILGLVLNALEKPADPMEAPFEPVALVLTRRDGRPHLAATDRILPLLRRIRRGWRPGRRNTTGSASVSGVGGDHQQGVGKPFPKLQTTTQVPPGCAPRGGLG
jgi:hypothetical protein